MPSYLWKREQIVKYAEHMLMSECYAQHCRQRPEAPHPDLSTVARETWD
jgi:hypothetical protein